MAVEKRPHNTHKFKRVNNKHDDDDDDNRTNHNHINGNNNHNNNKTSKATYKVLLLGESGVGKTSLIRSLTGSPFSYNMLSTVGIDFVKMPFEVDGAHVTLQIWDTAGQERFRSISRSYYRDTKGLLLVYDVTNKDTFEMLDYWLNSIENNFDKDTKEPVPVVMVGNKLDMTDQRQVTYQQGQKVSERNYMAGFFETSAKDGTNIKECFQHLADSIVDTFDRNMMDMYRLSSAIDTIKRSVSYPGADTEGVTMKQDPTDDKRKPNSVKINQTTNKDKSNKQKVNKNQRPSNKTKDRKSKTIKLNKFGISKKSGCNCAH